MSTCSTSDLTSISGSDYSEFAAWEAANPLWRGESREQSLIDMARADRVWEGEDSSNDAGEAHEEVIVHRERGRGGRGRVVLDSTSTVVGHGEGGKAEKGEPRTRTLRSRKIEIGVPAVVGRQVLKEVVVPEKGLSQDLQGRKLVSSFDLVVVVG